MHHHSPSLKPGLILYLFLSFTLISYHQAMALPVHPPSPSSLPMLLLGPSAPLVWSSYLSQLSPHDPCYQNYCQSDLSKHKALLLFYLSSPLLWEVPTPYQNFLARCVVIMPLLIFSFSVITTLLPPDSQTHQTSFTFLLCQAPSFWVSHIYALTTPPTLMSFSWLRGNSH